MRQRNEVKDPLDLCASEEAHGLRFVVDDDVRQDVDRILTDELYDGLVFGPTQVPGSNPPQWIYDAPLAQVTPFYDPAAESHGFVPLLLEASAAESDPRVERPTLAVPMSQLTSLESYETGKKWVRRN